jgi:hypothetical protein
MMVVSNTGSLITTTTGTITGYISNEFGSYGSPGTALTVLTHSARYIEVGTAVAGSGVEDGTVITQSSYATATNAGLYGCKIIMMGATAGRFEPGMRIIGTGVPADTYLVSVIPGRVPDVVSGCTNTLNSAVILTANAPYNAAGQYYVICRGFSLKCDYSKQYLWGIHYY